MRREGVDRYIILNLTDKWMTRPELVAAGLVGLSDVVLCQRLYDLEKAGRIKRERLPFKPTRYRRLQTKVTTPSGAF